MASVWPAVKVDEINFYLQLLCSLWQCLPVMNEAPSEARKTMVSATCKFVLLSHALILYVLLILKSYSDIRWLTNFSRGHYSKATNQQTCSKILDPIQRSFFRSFGKGWKHSDHFSDHSKRICADPDPFSDPFWSQELKACRQISFGNGSKSGNYITSLDSKKIGYS